MPDDRALHQARRFERFWDALVSGRTARPANERTLDPAVVAAARRLQALNRPVITDPTFEAKLWEDLMNAHPGTTTVPTPLIGPNGRHGHVLPPPVRQPPGRTRREPGRLSNGLSVVATAVLVVIVLGMLVFTYRTGQRAVIPPAQETPTTVPAAITEDWPMFRGDAARSSSRPVHGPQGTPVELWRYQTQGRIDAAPALVAGILYVASEDGALYALAATTGAEVWRAPLGAGSGASVVVADGVVYVTDNNHVLHAIDAATGQERWALPGFEGDPGAVVDGILYQPGVDGQLHAIEVAAGEERWGTPLGGGGASRTVAVASGIAFVGSKDGHINALNTTSGALLWSVEVGPGTVATPAVVNGVVYSSTFGGPDNRVLAVDAARGTVIWSFQTTARADVRPPAVDSGLAYVVSGDGNVYALDAATGAERWRFAAGGPITAFPSLAGDTAYVTAHNGTLFALDAATGAERWRFAYGSSSDYPAIVANGTAYLAVDGGYVMAIGNGVEAPTTGSPPATAPAAPTSATSVASPAVAADPVQFVWQTTGGAQPFVNPHPIVIDPHGTLWVADARGQFQLFDLDGTYLETWGTPGSGDGQFNFVRPNGDTYGGVAFGQDGALYIVDTGNLRVQKFDRDRTFVKAWGGQGTGDGQFLDPLSIAIDGQGMLYVLDDLRDDVQVFDGDGVFLRRFRVHEALGLSAGQPNSCNQLTVDGTGNVYVTSYLYTSVLKFDPSGAFVGQIGAFGSGLGQFQQPDGIAVDPAGNLFVTDSNAGRIQVFAPDGTVLAQWGSPGTDPGQFSTPAGIVVRGPNVYVAEYSGNRIQKFRLTGPLPGAVPSTS